MHISRVQLVNYRNFERASFALEDRLYDVVRLFNKVSDLFPYIRNESIRHPKEKKTMMLNNLAKLADFGAFDVATKPYKGVIQRIARRHVD